MQPHRTMNLASSFHNNESGVFCTSSLSLTVAPGEWVCVCACVVSCRTVGIYGQGNYRYLSRCYRPHDSNPLGLIMPPLWAPLLLPERPLRCPSLSDSSKRDKATEKHRPAIRNRSEESNKCDTDWNTHTWDCHHNATQSTHKV